MDKLLTFSGGQPLTTGDLEFLQQCYGDTLKALVSGLLERGDGARHSCILSGIRGDAGHVEAGAVADFRGDIYMVKEPIPRTTERYLCFREKEEDERTFADSSTHAVRLVHEAYVSDSAPTSAGTRGFELDALPTLAEVLDGKDSWKEIGAAGISFVGGTTGKVEYNAPMDAFRIQINRVAPFEGTALFQLDGNPYPGVFVGIAISNTFKPYVMWMMNGACSVYNMDGTQIDNSTELHFNKAILNRY